jgi:prophage DNA circulation protein
MMVDSPWRDQLRPASFRGAGFYVDLGSRTSGRRVALHEFPHRDDPYAEDLGRRARRHTITAYCIGPFYKDDRDILVEALEAEVAGLYVHPTQGEFQVMVEAYSTAERREKGGYAEFEITFCEAGNASPFTLMEATGALVNQAADASDTAMIGNMDSSIKAGPR